MTDVNNQKNNEYWRAHVLRAGAYQGTNQEYCREERLNPSTFASYKKRMGLTRVTGVRRRAFVQVEAAQPPRAVSEMRTQQLPDPRWVAAVLLNLVNDSR